MQIAETLALLRSERGYSQEDVAEYFRQHGRPLTRKAVSKWELGGSMPDAGQFLLLCQLYGVNDVMGTVCGAESGKLLNDLGRRKLLEYFQLLQLSDMYLAEPVKPQRITRSIPLYDLPVSAGTGQFLDSDRYELIEVDEAVPLDATFAVRVSGDSMEPRFTHGQIIYIKPQQTLEPGEIGIFVLNGEALCKELGDNNGQIALISLNPEYAPRVVGVQDELRVMGKVVA